jgi:hypothetical protein
VPKAFYVFANISTEYEVRGVCAKDDQEVGFAINGSSFGVSEGYVRPLPTLENIKSGS